MVGRGIDFKINDKVRYIREVYTETEHCKFCKSRGFSPRFNLDSAGTCYIHKETLEGVVERIYISEKGATFIFARYDLGEKDEDCNVLGVQIDDKDLIKIGVQDGRL